jgi:hypothetical protein
METTVKTISASAAIGLFACAAMLGCGGAQSATSQCEGPECTGEEQSGSGQGSSEDGMTPVCRGLRRDEATGQGRQPIVLRFRSGLDIAVAERQSRIEGDRAFATPITLTITSPDGPLGADLVQLNTLLGDGRVIEVSPMFPDAAAGSEPDARSLYQAHVCMNATDAEVASLVSALAAIPLLEEAYVQPIPEDASNDGM